MDTIMTGAFGVLGRMLAGMSQWKRPEAFTSGRIRYRIGTKATKARSYRDAQRREALRRQRTDKPGPEGR